MGSIFINAGLAAGVALAALPVILHLFMKQTPKKIVFPALRLIKERQRRSRKKLRIKNWLLLLARMALLALMALALARPRVNSTTTLGDREVPTAMVLVFDTSLSMSYKQQDKTRLDEAKQRARALLTRSHEASRVFVIDSADPIAPAPLSPGAARTRIEALAVLPVNRPLNEAVSRAYEAIQDAAQPRREVYVFTDLARSSWDTGAGVIEGALTDDATDEQNSKPDAAASTDAQKKKKASSDDGEAPRASTFLVRLGVSEPRDAALVEAGPILGFTAEGEPVPIRAVVRSTGPATTRVVEFLIDGKKRGQETVKLPADGETTVEFTTPKLGPGLHRGEVHLGGEPDSFEANDHRYFTLDVQPPLRVLVVSDVPIDAEFLTEALDPRELRATGPRPYPVDRVSTSQFEAGKTRSSERLRRNIPFERGETARGVLGPAQHLRPSGRGARRRSGKPGRSDRLEHQPGRSALARDARRVEGPGRARLYLRPGRCRPPPVRSQHPRSARRTLPRSGG